ncbi:uncharacterized protein LACBIDRAFT_296036 [Laccaria bicolor S238N-H82]|uniref:Predicted protein n=1 Tax=Laccaria bicolor (strain S238N-H82 / ATCC MYA-4686) TaxID=486041 RepID=B0E2E0_LACBS|nr:uncharacterized protein LACBIDRAFT_296036 [Laccaria bicolor S238N-H82]EDQ98993.1 predicted protein [Laccaria bicolor S238N-H82]|eukprot:XP_001890354.1 predicted protein [Laccaria bicolor S238N-H82]
MIGYWATFRDDEAYGDWSYAVMGRAGRHTVQAHESGQILSVTSLPSFQQIPALSCYPAGLDAGSCSDLLALLKEFHAPRFLHAILGMRAQFRRGLHVC